MGGCTLDGLSDHERVSYYSTMPTLEINTLFHPSLIRFAYYMIMSTSRCILLDFSHIGDQHIEDHVWFEDRWMVASWCDE
jgi:hypothetical protein